MKTETLVAQQKAVITFNQSRVCDLLQWQPDKQATFIYDRGHEYLDEIFGKDGAAIYKLSRRTEFWNWWKNQWNIRDEVYLHDVDGREDQLSLKFRNTLYSELHNAKILAAELSIPRIVYPQDFTTINIEMA